MSSIAEEITRTDPESTAPVMMITANNGFIEQSDRYAFNNAGKSLKKYILLEKGEMAYNHGASKLRSYGSCFALTTAESARIPFVYHCFSVGDNDPEFVSMELNGTRVENQLRKIVSSGARMDGLLNISYEEYASVELVMTCIPEQHILADYFRQLNHLITLHQSKSFWYILKSIVSCTLYWEQRKLGEVTTSYSGGTPNVSNCEYYGDEIPFIRSGEINNRHTDLFITEKGLLNSSAAMVKEGDILYALYGATSGEVSRSKLKGAINQAILAILPKTKYDSEYIAQWLKIKKRYIVDTYLQGGQGNLSGNIVKNFIVDFSSYNEQLNIGNLASSLDHLITLHQLEPYNLIFKAIAYRIIDYAKSKPPKCIK